MAAGVLRSTAKAKNGDLGRDLSPLTSLSPVQARCPFQAKVRKENMTNTRFQIVLWLVLMGLATNVRAQEVSIPDAGLNAAIREALPKPAGPLTAEDLLSLTDLDASRRGASSLEGLGAAHNLTTLYVNDNHLTDVTSLAGLPSLTTLDLSNNQLTSSACRRA